MVTCPFTFEGRRRRQQALQGVLALRGSVDTVIIIPNDKLRDVAGEDTSLTGAFALADEVLRQGVQVRGVARGGVQECLGCGGAGEGGWQCRGTRAGVGV